MLETDYPFIASKFSFSLFLLRLGLIIPLIFAPTLFGQSSQRPIDRAKNFGKSLKVFCEKDSKKERNATEDDVVRIETDLIITDALVVDQNGKLVAGLEKDDFVVLEGGVLQEVELFSAGPDSVLPKSIVLIIENGGIPSVVRKNIDSVRSLIEWLGPKDRLAIVSDNVKLISDFTTDKETLNRSLDRLEKRPGASRREYSSLLAALNELYDGWEKRPIILIQATGDEFLTLKPIWSNTHEICKRGHKDLCERSFGFTDVLSAVERSRATIYGIVPTPRVTGLSKEEQIKKAQIILDGFSDELHDRRDKNEKEKFRNEWAELTALETDAMQTSLIDVTRLSGGFTTFLESSATYSDLYSSLFKTIDGRYLLGYYSKSVSTTGMRRGVRIEVRNNSNYKILARSSYVPRGASK